MISSVRGPVLAVTTLTSGTVAIVDVGGVGLAVQITPGLARTLAVGRETTIHTALIVREDDLSLFGFATADELAVFDLLRGVGGVGPKSALGVLATLTPAEIAQAVADEDDAPFRRVSGIGPKTAKLIVVSLAGKLAAPATGSTAPRATSDVAASVIAALVGLGWPERLASQTVDEVIDAASPDDRAAVPVVLRLALAQLGPQHAGPRVGTSS
jgi:Holliday junction DNA helicase RuvA